MDILGYALIGLACFVTGILISMCVTRVMKKEKVRTEEKGQVNQAYLNSISANQLENGTESK